MIALVFLIGGSVVVSTTWNENYGDSRVDVSGTFNNAIHAMKTDIRIPILGMIQSLFEASMYCFVFMWTPALETAGQLSTKLIFI